MKDILNAIVDVFNNKRVKALYITCFIFTLGFGIIALMIMFPIIIIIALMLIAFIMLYLFVLDEFIS